MNQFRVVIMIIVYVKNTGNIFAQRVSGSSYGIEILTNAHRKNLN